MGRGGGRVGGGMEDSFGDHMVFKGNGGRINHDQKSIKEGLLYYREGCKYLNTRLLVCFVFALWDFCMLVRRACGMCSSVLVE